MTKQTDLNSNISYNVNVILYKLLYRKQLFFKLYKHLIYRFYLTGQFVPRNFAKFFEKILAFFVMTIGACMSVMQKEMLCLNL